MYKRQDGNIAPGNPKLQTEINLTAGKTFDATISPPKLEEVYANSTLAIFDRQLSLTANGNPNSGMYGYLNIGTGNAAAFTGAAMCPATLNPNFTVPLNALTYSGNVLSGVMGVGSLVVGTVSNGGTVTLASNGLFTYSGPAIAGTAVTFGFTGTCTNGSTVAVAGTATLTAVALGGMPTVASQTFSSHLATSISVPRPGLLAGALDPSNYPLTVSLVATTSSCLLYTSDAADE